jgi:hypothetical protein
MVDFKVFHGTTSSEAIHNNQVNVLKKFTTMENIVIGITDTMSSMGVLGQFLCNKGMQHAYSTDHNLQCNATLTFSGKSICNLPAIFIVLLCFDASLSTNSLAQMKIFQEQIMPCQKLGRLLNTFPSQHSRLQS